MHEFSIDLEAERIYDPRTRGYFSEVLSSYINGNYRSSIVMLWTVVVCDCVYKLQHMRDLYEDSTAQSILQNTEELQKRNPKSSEWEIQLIRLIRERTSLLEEGELKQLEHLQQQRHLAAHPILNQTDLLYAPNKDSVRASIRSALESVLLKPPILTKKIIETFVTDLAEKQGVLPDEKSLQRYLDAKYLKNLSAPVENELFRALWKFVFALSNEDTDRNLDINLRTLKLLYKRRPSDLDRYIQENSQRFNNMENGRVPLLIRFLSEHPRIYGCLTDAARTLIENTINNNIDLFVMSTFLSNNVNEHISRSIEKIRESMNEYPPPVSMEAWELLEDLVSDDKDRDQVVRLAIDAYCNSMSFYEADRRFKNLLRPQLEFLKKVDQIIGLLQGIEQNPQTFRRNLAKQEHKYLKEHFDTVLGADFDYSTYPNFEDSIQDE